MPRTSRSSQFRRNAEHFTYFLVSEGYLKDGYSLDKRRMREIFIYEYLPKYPVQIRPFHLLQFLIRIKCVKRLRKNKNNDIQSLSDNTVVFIPKKVDAIFLDYSNKSEVSETLLDISAEKPVVKLFVTQQHAFDLKYKKSAACTEKECLLCKVNFNNQTEYEKHINEEIHKIRENYRSDSKMTTWRGDLAEKRIMSDLEDFDHVFDVVVYDENNGSGFIAENSGLVQEVQKIHIYYRKENMKTVMQARGLSIEDAQDRDTISLPLDFEFQSGGAYDYPIVFKLSNDLNKSSYVLKELVFRVQHAILDDLKPTSPYVKPLKPIQKVEEVPVLSGEPPPLVKSGLVYEVKLAQYQLSASLRRIINHGLRKFLKMTPQDREKLNEVRSLLELYTGVEVSQLLKEEKHAEFLSLLLYIEEHQMEIDIHIYDHDDAKMEIVKENKKLLSLDVPGLSENRPSVLRGDRIHVKIQGDSALVKYEGQVHFVRETQVWLGFNKALREKFLPNMKFHVEYSVNRLPVRVQHRALEMIKDCQLSYILFPKQHSKKEIFNLTWYNRKVNQNPEQQQAVINILAGTAYPSPYLVFGPPGTGKTVTVVEAITQLYHKKKPNGHILVCAPSNSAADEIAKRLVVNKLCPNGYIPESSIFRLYAASRNPSTIPEELKKCCNYIGEFYYPSKEEIMKYNIVIVTLTTAGRLVSGGIPAGHFSHLFIDECGQAVEPETLIPLAGLFGSKEDTGRLLGQWILVGDPKQLGPILRSPVAKKLGLDVSLLERLMNKCDLYQKDEATNQYNSNVLTKLIQNFRSHKHILALPNNLFYDNELQVCADPALTSLACNWEHLPNRGFPVIFYGVQGKDQREGNSPSYFNLQEIDVIMSYVERILDDRFSGRKLQQNEIGIITPYRKQVEKVRKAFKKKRWDNIHVGSVEEFQGQERLVIIISTVRSNMELVSEDYKFHLGFLQNPKVNVALTRAKALLIVVGNPNVLQCDFHWRELIMFCRKNGSYIGCPFKMMDLPPQEQENLVLDFAALQINPSEKGQPED
ncbi:hypothetical protein L9F63_000788, partial [Diploptera punctata]